MDLFTTVLLLHIISAVIGLGGATFIEIFLIKSLLDGQIDPVEGGFMKITSRVLRVGLVGSLVTGLGLILIWRLNDNAFRLYDPVLWAKFTILLVLIVNGILLHSHAIPLRYSSAISFVSWYAVFIFGFLAKGQPIAYMLLLIYYILALIVGYLALQGIRRSFGVIL